MSLNLYDFTFELYSRTLHVWGYNLLRVCFRQGRKPTNESKSIENLEAAWRNARFKSEKSKSRVLGQLVELKNIY